MVKYKCERCGYIGKQKGDFRKHLNRKKPCNPILKNISIDTLKKHFINGYAEDTPEYAENTPEYAENTLEYAENTPKYAENTLKYADSKKENVCPNCGRCFKQNRYMVQHVNRGNCKYKKKSEIQTDTEIESEPTFNLKNKEFNSNNKDILEMMMLQHEKEKEEWLKEKEYMRDEISKLIDKVEITNVYNTVNQQNIFINNHGHENLDYITSKYLDKLLDMPYGAIPKLIKDIHFHPKHPENHNVKITNKKLPYATIYKDSQWVIKDKKEVIENMVDNGFNMIESYYDEESKDGKKQSKCVNFLSKYDNKERDLLKKLNKDTELILLNNSKNNNKLI